MWIVGSAALLGAGLNYAFRAVDGLGLTTNKAKARVCGMGYRQGGSTYMTEIIGMSPVVPPQANPEEYLLKLEIGSEQTTCAVAKALFDTLSMQDTVRVSYQRRRLTGALRVTNIQR